MITCEDTYHSKENGVWKNGKGETESTLDGFLEDVISDYRPVCIRKDGIELVDDVGGIYGFCDMLRTICCKNSSELWAGSTATSPHRDW